MPEKFTESTRRALAFARYEAGRRGSGSLEPEHLLLGILRARDDRVMKLLAHFDVAAEALAQPFQDDTLPAATAASLKGDMTLSEGTKSVMAKAAAEKDALGSESIAPEHLLLGVVSLESSPAARILAEKGINAAGLRHEVQRLASG